MNVVFSFCLIFIKNLISHEQNQIFLGTQPDEVMSVGLAKACVPRKI